MALILICFIGAFTAGIYCAVALNMAWLSLLAALGAWLGLSLIIGLFYLSLKLIIDTSKPVESVKPIYRWLTFQAGQLVCFYTGVRPRIENEGIIPTDSRFLMVSNHRSGFDAIALLSAKKMYKFGIAFIMKPAVMKIPVANSLGPACGFLAIDRENDRNALRTILQAADYLKKDICSVFIFPEGTRAKGGEAELLPFHAGSFKIAQRANVPVVIAAVYGADKVKENFLHRRTAVTIRVLEVVPAEKVKASNTSELADYARERIKADILQNTVGR